mmetsp:Transcript_5868/g.9685  ORF Transcript_5868/g.9685 Transcript_5868/m.9685 type:complete len:169 (-) Transcript_5868:158-664(-)
MLRRAFTSRTASLVNRSSFSCTSVRFYAGAGDDGAAKGDLLLSFTSPYEVIFKNEKIESVTVPAEEGRFGIYPDHVPTIAQLKPGVVEIVRNKETSKYFVGAGFVGMHPGSVCHISVTECFPLSDLDKSEATAGLEEAKRDASSAHDEKSKVENRIRVETFEAILAEI